MRWALKPTSSVASAARIARSFLGVAKAYNKIAISRASMVLNTLSRLKNTAPILRADNSAFITAASLRSRTNMAMSLAMSGLASCSRLVLTRHNPCCASVSKRFISLAASAARRCLAVVLFKPFTSSSANKRIRNAAGLVVASLRCLLAADDGVLTIS